MIRLNIPPLTEERRRDLTGRTTRAKGDARSRSATSAATPTYQVKEPLKDKQITEGRRQPQRTEIQKITDAAIRDVDEVVKAKERNWMAV